MISLYLVTDQYEPYMPSWHQCTGSSRRRRSKYGCQMSSWYSFGLLTSSSPSGIAWASAVGSKCTGAFILDSPQEVAVRSRCAVPRSRGLASLHDDPLSATFDRTDPTGPPVVAYLLVRLGEVHRGGTPVLLLLDLKAELLAFAQAAQTSLLHGADVNEHVLPTR